MGSFASTPTFELFRRGLEPRVLQKFRGINTYRSLAELGPQHAQDCLNVIAPGWGGLSKLRLPQALSAAIGATGPNIFFDFQQGNGTRQVVANIGNSIYYYTWNGAGTALNAGILIETSGNDAPPWSFAEANNMLFGANGIVMKKWTGANWWNNGIAGPAMAPVASAVALPVGANMTEILGIANLNQIFVTVNNPPGFNASPGQSVIITGTVHYNGTYPIALLSNSIGGTTEAFLTSAPPPSTVLELNAGVITLSPQVAIIGWSWGYAYKNSITGHVGNISPTTAPTIPAATFGTQLLAVAPTDPQVDTIVWFRTLDGGGNWYREVEVNINTGALILANTGIYVSVALSGGKYLILNDYNSSDSALDTLTQGPLINNPPPVGYHLTIGQSRVFIANLVGAPNQIAYSGYEQIFYGQPAESYPPYNRIKLNIGAESVNGIGVLDAGIVAFSATNRMYMLRGQIEDITQSAPVQFSAYLKELPWKIGTMCHDSIQATPFGLVFLATDKTVQYFDGYSTLSDISRPVYPILQRMTTGYESQAKSAYFNWLNLDLYALTFPIDGSVVNNYTLLWVLNKETQEIDVFPCNIPMTSIGILTTPLFQRLLAIGNGGIISNLPASQDTVNGIAVLNDIPPTNGQLPAYWRSGYAGNDSSQRMEMWRWIRLITDQPPQAYSVQFRVINDDTNLITNPYIIGPVNSTSPRKQINRRGKRLSVEIDFPQQDVSANVLELQILSIPSSDR